MYKAQWALTSQNSAINTNVRREISLLELFIVLLRRLNINIAQLPCSRFRHPFFSCLFHFHQPLFCDAKISSTITLYANFSPFPLAAILQIMYSTIKIAIILQEKPKICNPYIPNKYIPNKNAVIIVMSRHNRKSLFATKTRLFFSYFRYKLFHFKFSYFFLAFLFSGKVE